MNKKNDNWEQIEIFEQPLFKINKPIRLIELFAGIGSQAMALRDLNANFEHYGCVEFDKYAIKSYNAIHGTNFTTTDIRDIKGEDLKITNTDKYCYIVTYSFPCQDLSVAGKGAGMEKGGGTRSRLLWEVERILDEINMSDDWELPQVLLMENVTQVHGKKNVSDFNLWANFLNRLGYSNHWQDLNAKEVGYPEPVAQNRNRCFMVSILGNYGYKFPETKTLNTVMADYLDEEVEEKYYINSDRANELINKLVEDGDIGGGQDIRCKRQEPLNKSASPIQSGRWSEESVIGDKRVTAYANYRKVEK